MTKLDLSRLLNDIVQGLKAFEFLYEMEAEKNDDRKREKLVNLASGAHIWYQKSARESEPVKMLTGLLGPDQHLSVTRFPVLMEGLLKLGKEKGIAGSVKSYKIFLEKSIQFESVLNNLLDVKEVSGQYAGETPSVLAVTIVSDEDSVQATRLIKVIQAVVDIIEAFGEFYEKPYSTDIILLDSGSDKIVVFKTGAELTNLLLATLKEVIDMFANRKLRKREREADVLLKELDVLNKVQESIDSGALDKESGARIKHKIGSGMETLVEERAVPKQLAEINYGDSSVRKMLQQKDIKELPPASE